ncbi:MAG: hypothetical protein PVSMB7_13490 [Chloroflexota bacterium]
MLHGGWGRFVLGRANPLVPAAVALCGVLVATVGPRAPGLGLAVGALLAFVNSALLSRRIDMAAEMDDVGRALLLMQVGLLVTCTIIALATIVLIHFSVGTAIAAAAGFAVAQLGSLATFYWTQGRGQTSLEGKGV